MKTFNIEIPKGYEIDKEKSTFETIIFKEVKNELPKTWAGLKFVDGYFTDDCSSIYDYSGLCSNDNKNTFFSPEQAEASLALAQLSQLREVYRNGWKPDYTSKIQRKYCIYFFNNEINIDDYGHPNFFLCFQDSETAHLFLENFKDLILTAKPLMS